MASHLRIWIPNHRLRMLSSAFSTVAVVLLPFVAGCSDEDPVVVDTRAPYPPDGVFSETHNGFVTICWNENWEEDLAGYAIYRCNPRTHDCESTDGLYSHVADVSASQLCYDDTNVNNGETWYYAVTAFDQNGNESELSYENVFDTPRPDGTNLSLFDCLGQNNGSSGYDFSSESGVAQSCSSPSADIYFGATNGVNYIVAASGVDIQDFGWTTTLDELSYSPDQGWAPSGRVEAIVDHGYFIRIVDGVNTNFAKVRVTAVTSPLIGPDLGRVTLDWAYQTDVNNPELAPGVKGGASK